MLVRIKFRFPFRIIAMFMLRVNVRFIFSAIAGLFGCYDSD